MSAVARLDEWMCETHRRKIMGHGGCDGAGEPAYNFNGVAHRRTGGVAHLVDRTMVAYEFQRYEALVYATDLAGVEWQITYDEWFGEATPETGKESPDA